MYNVIRRGKMIVKSLKIINYRNYVEQKVEFSNGLNVLCGVNASGKTNMLEAIYLCGIGKSPRVSQDKDLIMWGKDYLYVMIEIEKKYKSHKAEIHIDKHNKRIALDGMAISKVGELMGMLNVIFFSPDELKMIKESPKERRRFMDISLSQQKKVYFYLLQRYNRILEQRNKLLKTTKSVTALNDMLPVWDIQLADVGADIITNRMNFIDKLNCHARIQHSLLTDNKENLSLEYESDTISNNKEELKDMIMKLYLQNRDKDYSLKYTTSGPHRDDIKISVNNIDVRKYGSQGQQRSAALSLKLAEISHFEQETGEKPILLLDDVLSELDSLRQMQLIESTKGIQTFLTCTDYDIVSEIIPRIYKISKGNVENNSN